MLALMNQTLINRTARQGEAVLARLKAKVLAMGIPQIQASCPLDQLLFQGVSPQGFT